MSTQTPSHPGLIDQLEDALGGKDLARRAEILRKVTDLFVLRSGSFSESQIELFDSVMSRLLENIESATRAQFGSRIARLPEAPRGVVVPLFFHDRCYILSGEDLIGLFCELEGLNRAAFHFRALRWLSISE